MTAWNKVLNLVLDVDRAKEPFIEVDASGQWRRVRIEELIQGSKIPLRLRLAEIDSSQAISYLANDSGDVLSLTGKRRDFSGNELFTIPTINLEMDTDAIVVTGSLAAGTYNRIDPVAGNDEEWLLLDGTLGQDYIARDGTSWTISVDGNGIYSGTGVTLEAVTFTSVVPLHDPAPTSAEYLIILTDPETWIATLDLHTENLDTAMSTYPTIGAVAQIDLLSNDGEIKRSWQFNTAIQRKTHTGTPPDIDGANTYLTEAQSDARYARITQLQDVLLSRSVAVPASRTSAGEPGDYAIDIPSSLLWVYTGDGTAHTWQTTVLTDENGDIVASLFAMLIALDDTATVPDMAQLAAVVDDVATPTELFYFALGDGATVRGIPVGFTADNAVLVNHRGTNATRGAALVAAYAKAKTLTPGGAAIGAGNPATLLVYPGTHALSATLIWDAPYINLIVIGAAEGVYATLSGASIHVTANNCAIVGISVGSQRFRANGNLSGNVYAYCSGTGNFSWTDYDSGGGMAPMLGQHFRCIAGPYGFGGAATSRAAGTFDGCTGGLESLVVTSGKLLNCRLTSGEYDLAAITGAGKIRNCIDGNWDTINADAP